MGLEREFFLGGLVGGGFRDKRERVKILQKDHIGEAAKEIIQA